MKQETENESISLPPSKKTDSDSKIADTTKKIKKELPKKSSPNPFKDVGKKAGKKDDEQDKKPKKEFKGDLRQYIIDNVPITSIYPHSLKGNRGICAFKSSQKSPSFVLYGDSWSCWSCKHENRQYKGGDVICLKANLDGISYGEALNELAKENGIQMSEQDKIIMDQRATIKEIHEYFAKLCEENLQNSKYFDFVKENRGFPEEFMKKKRIGLVDRNIQRKMEDTYSKLELQWAGLLNDKGNWECRKRIVYPYFDISNHPNYFIYRRIDAEPDYDAKYVKMYVKGSPSSKNSLVENPIFGLETLNEREYNPDILVISEGMTDALSCHLSKFASISPITTSFKDADEKRVIKYLQRYKNGKIVIINDNELNKAGEKGGEKTLHLLLKNNLPVSFGKIPNPDGLDKIDLDMCLQAETPEKRTKNLQDLIDTAKEGLDFLIENLPKKENDEDIVNIIRFTFYVKDGEIETNLAKRRDLVEKLKKKKIGSTTYKIYEKRALKEFVKEMEKEQQKQLDNTKIPLEESNQSKNEDKIDKILLDSKITADKEIFDYLYNDHERNMIYLVKEITGVDEKGLPYAFKHEGKILAYCSMESGLEYTNPLYFTKENHLSDKLMRKVEFEIIVKHTNQKMYPDNIILRSDFANLFPELLKDN